MNVEAVFLTVTRCHRRNECPTWAGSKPTEFGKEKEDVAIDTEHVI